MFYYTITNSCPYCGFEYRVDHTTSRSYKDYGCSLIICPVCKKGFIDKRIKERALEDFRMPTIASAIFVSTVLGIPVGFGVYILVAIIAAIFKFHMTEELMKNISIIGGILFAAGFFISRIVNYDKILAFNRKEYEESEKRLSVLAYAQSLQAAGFKVPEKFLATNDTKNNSEGETKYTNMTEGDLSNEYLKSSSNAKTDDNSAESIYDQHIVFYNDTPSTKEAHNVSVRFCQKCGTAISTDSIFCRRCGEIIKME